MKLTPILYVRSWISKLHPPMPTTARENKQLLSLLSSSFQRQLDAAHPPIQPADHPPQRIVSASGHATDNIPARATIDHLQSLLQHPLLAQKTVDQTENPLTTTQAAAMMDRAMLRGDASLDMVGRCMQVYMKTGPDRQMFLKDEARIGRRVSAWFTSSNADTKEKFLSSPELLRNAVPILFAEGMEETVWDWLEFLYARKLGADSLQTTTKPLRWVLQESHLTFLMIKEAMRRSRLDAAVLQFIQTCDYMQRTGRMSSEARSSQSWQAMAKTVTIAVLRRRHQHGLPAHLFDSLLEHRFLWSDPVPFAFELVSLYNPTRPSARDLSSAIGQGDDLVQAQFDRIKAMSEPAKKITLNALLDGARLLLKQNSSSVRPARLIVHLVEKQFPNLANREGDEAAQRRVQSARHTLIPQPFMPAVVGVS